MISIHLVKEFDPCSVCLPEEFERCSVCLPEELQDEYWHVLNIPAPANV